MRNLDNESILKFKEIKFQYLPKIPTKTYCIDSTTLNDEENSNKNHLNSKISRNKPGQNIIREDYLTKRIYSYSRTTKSFFSNKTEVLNNSIRPNTHKFPFKKILITNSSNKFEDKSSFPHKSFSENTDVHMKFNNLFLRNNLKKNKKNANNSDSKIDKIVEKINKININPITDEDYVNSKISTMKKRLNFMKKIIDYAYPKIISEKSKIIRKIKEGNLKKN